MPPAPSSSPAYQFCTVEYFTVAPVERDELDDRRMQLVRRSLGCRASFEVADVRALVGDDQRPLELAGVGRVDPEVGRQLHRAPHALRHVHERPVGEDGRVERGEEVVAVRHDRAEVPLHELGVLAHRLAERAEDDPVLHQLRLVRRADRHRVEHGIDRHAGEQLLLAAAGCRACRTSRGSSGRARPGCLTAWPSSAPSSRRWPGSRSADTSRSTSAARSSVCQRRNAFRRHSSIHSGSFLRAEIARTTSSLRPGGSASASMSVAKPYW